jgi:hypothetical protein
MDCECYLRALYGLFKDSPARRADYIAITGCSVFALKFCQVRWVENVAVAERALEILPHVRKYVKETKSLPHTVTCQNVQALCDDKLGEAKIAFFLSVCNQLQPLLYDAVRAAGGLTAVDINKSMMHYVRGSHGRYTEALERKRLAAAEENKKLAEKKRVADAIKTLKQRRLS